MTKTAVKEPELFNAKDAVAKPAPAAKLPAKRGAGKKTGTAVSTAVAPPSAPKSLMQIAHECALDARVDAGKMQAIIAMAREEQNRIDEREFELARLAVQIEIPPITKDTLNKHTNSKWARLEKISAVADPIIRKHGFSLSYGEADCPVADHYRVTCDVTHTPTGYKKPYFMDVGMDAVGAKGGGTKSLAQGSGSSVTYARRFLKVMIFDINVVGEDFDGRRFTRNTDPGSAESVVEVNQDSEEQKLSKDDVEDMRAKIEACGVGEAKFCEFFKISNVEDLPPARYDEAVTACFDYGKRHQKRGTR